MQVHASCCKWVANKRQVERKSITCIDLRVHLARAKIRKHVWNFDLGSLLLILLNGIALSLFP